MKKSSYICAAVTLLAGYALAGESMESMIELDRDYISVDQEANTAVVRLTLNAPDRDETFMRQPLNLALVLDRSGSMEGEKLQQAQAAAIAVLDLLDENDRFALVTYARDVRVDVPSQSAANRDEIVRRIKAIEADGDSALFGGISRAAGELRKNRAKQYVGRIIVLSDGAANIGPNSPDILNRLAAGLRKEDISITTIGLGTNYSEHVMTGLARNSQGNTYFVESAEELKGVLQNEVEQLKEIVTRNVDVRLDFPEGVTPLELINGNEAQIHGNTLNTRFENLRQGEQKRLLVKTQLPPGVPGTTALVARASVTASDAAGGKDSSSSEVQVGYVQTVASPAPSQAYNDVQFDNAWFENAEQQQQAILLVDQGQPTAAAQTLRTSISNLQQVARNAPAAKKEQVKEKTKLLEEQVTELEQSQQLSPRNRKALLTDSVQDLGEQSVR